MVAESHHLDYICIHGIIFLINCRGGTRARGDSLSQNYKITGREELQSMEKKICFLKTSSAEIFDKNILLHI